MKKAATTGTAFKNEINNLKDMVVSINSGVDVDISDVDDDADKKSFSFTEGGVEDEIDRISRERPGGIIESDKAQSKCHGGIAVALLLLICF